MRSHRLIMLLTPVSAALLSCSVLLMAGLVLKQCPPRLAEGNSALLCYSDIDTFYEYRGLADLPFPYVSGSLAGTALRDGAVEYPVLTGLFMWLPAQVVHGPAAYLSLSALLLAGPALAVAVVLSRWAGWRALLWSCAPALALFAFHNWDLLAVASTVLGLDAWRRSRRTTAAAWFAVGTACKLYPLLFLAPLVLECLLQRDRRGALRAAGGFALVSAVLQLPFLLVNPQGWLATYQFHARRPPNVDSLFGQFAMHWDVSAVNALTSSLLAVLGASVLATGAFRARRSGAYRLLPVAGALLAVFMLTNKVSSPQYTLWLLPFLVVLRVHPVWWVVYALNDALLYVAVFYAGPISLDLAQPWLRIGVVLRACLLAILAIQFLRASVTTGEEDACSRRRDGQPTLSLAATAPAG